ncbi:hypothetical protein ACFSOZ_26000 [Mesorhizobium newzealandense]|uniref:Uncharacterized protein n=1 Tax=Mesorhizobium newzealandense TaxID=1300302 RepID=A0ABW4UJU4_9HYPH
MVQTLRRAKEAARIGSGRPFAPPIAERDIARMLLALSAPSPSRAVEHEKATGRLVSPDGLTVESAIMALLSADATEGQIAVSQDGRFVEIRTLDGVRTFGSPCGGFVSVFIIPIAAIVVIGGELLNK